LDPPPVVPHPESIAAQAAYAEARSDGRSLVIKMKSQTVIGKLSPSPRANSFVIGTAAINTHTLFGVV
jgi:hypothetical protein